MIGIFSALAMVMFSGWIVTVEYIMMVPILIGFFLFALIYRKTEKKDYKLINTVCLFFCACIFIFVIIIDVYCNPKAPSSFMTMLLVAIPITFIFRLTIVFPLIACGEVLYVIAAMQMKTGVILKNDVFNSVVAILLSFVTGVLVIKLRMNDKSAAARYERMSTIDALTGIFNKVTCENSIMDYLSVRDLTSKCALIMIDVDNFKSVNDEFGHQKGDDVLEEIGTILTHTFRSTDIIGRVGGDEFMVLLRNIPEHGIIEKKCNRLQDQMRELVNRVGIKNCSLSMGAVVLPEETVSFEKVFQMADDALYEAKSFGKERHVIQFMSCSDLKTANKNVMIVADDYDGVREQLKSIFEEQFKIIEAKDGNETLSLVGQYRDRVAVVLLDIEMPLVNGHQILKYMQERDSYSDIPVVVITSDDTNEKDALEAGARDVIIKPIDPDVAKLRVANAINSNK